MNQNKCCGKQVGFTASPQSNMKLCSNQATRLLLSRCRCSNSSRKQLMR